MKPAFFIGSQRCDRAFIVPNSGTLIRSHDGPTNFNVSTKARILNTRGQAFCLSLEKPPARMIRISNGFPDQGDVKARQARERLCRRILTTIWSSFISFLNSSLKTDNGSGQAGLGPGAPLIFAAKLTKLSAQEQQLNEEGIR